MRAELRDTLEQLFPDSTISPKPVRSLCLDVGRGGTAAVNLLLTGLHAGDKVRLAASGIAGVQWFRLVDVPVEENTGLHAFTEGHGDSTEPNPYVIRRAPFRVYDALEPVAAEVRAAGPVLALRLHASIPLQAKPGPRPIVIHVGCAAGEQELKLDLRIHAARIPPPGPKSLPYTNWFSFTLMAERHGLQAWSEAHWRMIRHYADLMVHGRQNMFWFTWSDVFRRTPHGLVLNRERLRRIVRTFSDAGMHWIEGGHVAGRSGGAWNAKTFDVALGGPGATSPAGNADLATALRQLREEIDANGWRERWIQHVTDEPIAENAADYRILVGMVRKYLPGIPLVDATMDTSLVGSVDIWCPKAHDYQQHREALEAQRAVGDRVWFYTCCDPGGPWLNRLMDMELLRPALFGWGAALFRLDGFLHWGLNHYRADQNPFERSVVGHEGEGHLPAGDTHVVYPGTTGPWSSVRFEAQREGFEDYELLRRLQARAPRQAAAVIRRAFRAFDDYTKDVKVFRAARRKLLECV